jgi:flagellar L-ring protein precursor FlgH
MMESRKSESRLFWLLISGSCLLLSGCSDTLNRLEGIGKAPPLAKVKDPTTDADYKPLTWPLPESPVPVQTSANSLWQPGARAFFRDGRASRVGDLLRVKINITDQAEFDNNTTSTRTTQETMAAPQLFGIENRFNGIGFGPGNVADGVSINGGNTHEGNVTVIDGKQEFLMNYDIRQVSIKGVVRPQDIDESNTVDSTQVAEARITYGGRGQNMDAQQRRWGSQAVDILSPF